MREDALGLLDQETGVEGEDELLLDGVDVAREPFVEDADRYGVGEGLCCFQVTLVGRADPVVIDGPVRR